MNLLLFPSFSIILFGNKMKWVMGDFEEEHRLPVADLVSNIL